MSIESRVSDSLRFRYVTANTPSYLFRYFAADPSVRQLSAAESVSDLEEQLRSILASDKSPDNAVIAYMLAVAIALKGGTSRNFALPWWNELMSLGQARHHPMTIECAKFNAPARSEDVGYRIAVEHLAEKPPSSRLGGGTAKMAEKKWNISLTKGS